MSNTTESKVRVARNFRRLTNDELATTGTAVATDMDGNPKVPEPPVRITDFKTRLQIFIAAAAAAQDGGKKAIAERNKQRKIFIRMLNKQADYVEEVAETDVTVVINTRFQVLITTDRKSTRLNSSHIPLSRMPSSA